MPILISRPGTNQEKVENSLSCSVNNEREEKLFCSETWKKNDGSDSLSTAKTIISQADSSVDSEGSHDSSDGVATQDEGAVMNGEGDNTSGRNLGMEFEKLYIEEEQYVDKDRNSENIRCSDQLSQDCENNIHFLSRKDTSGVVNHKNGMSGKDKVEIGEVGVENLTSPSCVIEQAIGQKMPSKEEFFPCHLEDNSTCDESYSNSEEEPTQPTTSTENSNSSPKVNMISMPDFYMHVDLKRNLSQHQVNRISFYSVVHNVNKEAAAMASNDQSVLKSEVDNVSTEHPSSTHEDLDEMKDSLSNSAMIDEEYWLLSAIASRTPEDTNEFASKTRHLCIQTFSEAVGEVDQSDSASNLLTQAECRTQLWKPGRSWWEARSGKNPWIEPRSHNKRWRYLWPLIHYHKFIARCIKKLKRNGVDVKSSQSPVSIFLREEVCAVSDHLAGVSKFTAEEWLRALAHFHGWTDTSPVAESCLRQMITQQKLRSMSEPSDMQSPLLKDQIDEQFLKAMAAARHQMLDVQDEETGGDSYAYNSQRLNTLTSSSPEMMSIYDGQICNYPCTGDKKQTQQNVRAEDTFSDSMRPKTAKGMSGQRRNGNRGRRGNTSSKFHRSSNQSAPKGGNFAYEQNVYQQHPYNGAHQSPHHQMHGGYYYTGPYYPQSVGPAHYQNHAQFWAAYQDAGLYDCEGFSPTYYPQSMSGKASHPSDYAAYDAMWAHQHPGAYVANAPNREYYNYAAMTNEHSKRHEKELSKEHCGAPFNETPPSPSWGHLDEAALAATNVPSPQHVPPSSLPSTITKRSSRKSDKGNRRQSMQKNNVKGLMFKQSSHNYNSAGVLVPPSPATQFLTEGPGWGSSPCTPSDMRNVSKEETVKDKEEMLGGETTSKAGSPDFTVQKELAQGEKLEKFEESK